jgi:HD-GYP domain-containing protein (c-di-GMP phosphodiesterase class II)
MRENKWKNKFNKIAKKLSIVVLTLVVIWTVHRIGYKFNPVFFVTLYKILFVVVLIWIYSWMHEAKLRRILKKKEKELASDKVDIKNMNLSTIKTLAVAIEAKDYYTRGHSDGVTRYAVEIAQEMGLPEKEIEIIKHAGILHDLGKLGIDNAILRKPGKLTDEEYNLVKKHPELGENMLMPLKFLKDEKSIVRHHHERFDGTGYPDGIKGKAIPLGARIIAVADTFDAITSDRPYRPIYPMNKAVEEIRECSGTQFDPSVVEAFLQLIKNDKYVELQERLERREFKRAFTDVSIQYRPETMGEDERKISRIRNIGGGGLCFRNRLIPEKSLLEIELKLPEIHSPIKASAKVVWTKKETEKALYNIGIAFENIAEEDRKNIIEYVEKMISKRPLWELTKEESI